MESDIKSVEVTCRIGRGTKLHPALRFSKPNPAWPKNKAKVVCEGWDAANCGNRIVK